MELPSNCVAVLRVCKEYDIFFRLSIILMNLPPPPFNNVPVKVDLVTYFLFKESEAFYLDT